MLVGNSTRLADILPVKAKCGWPTGFSKTTRVTLNRGARHLTKSVSSVFRSPHEEAELRGDHYNCCLTTIRYQRLLRTAPELECVLDDLCQLFGAQISEDGRNVRVGDNGGRFPNGDGDPLGEGLASLVSSTFTASRASSTACESMESVLKARDT